MFSSEEDTRGYTLFEADSRKRDNLAGNRAVIVIDQLRQPSWPRWMKRERNLEKRPNKDRDTRSRSRDDDDSAWLLKTAGPFPKSRRFVSAELCDLSHGDI